MKNKPQNLLSYTLKKQVFATKTPQSISKPQNVQKMSKLAISWPTKSIGFSGLPKPQTNHNNESTGENWAVYHQSKRKLELNNAVRRKTVVI